MLVWKNLKDYIMESASSVEDCYVAIIGEEVDPLGTVQA